MQSLRRALISRRDSKVNTEHCPRHYGQPHPIYVEHIRPRRSIDESYDGLPTLPPYSPPSDPDLLQTEAPPPAYCAVDDTPQVPSVVVPSARTRRQSRVDPQPLLDQTVRRIRESMKNQKAWRTHNNGQRSFFWALRCGDTDADILQENLDYIRSRVLLGGAWRVEKFCMLFKGQRLVDLWCRPVQSRVFSFSDLV